MQTQINPIYWSNLRIVSLRSGVAAYMGIACEEIGINAYVLLFIQNNAILFFEFKFWDPLVEC